MLSFAICGEREGEIEVYHKDREPHGLITEMRSLKSSLLSWIVSREDGCQERCIPNCLGAGAQALGTLSYNRSDDAIVE